MWWFIFLSWVQIFLHLCLITKLTTTLQKLTRQRKLKLVARINEPQQCVYLKSENAKATISLLKSWTLILKNHKCTSHHTYVHVSDITQIHPRLLRQIVFNKIKTCIILLLVKSIFRLKVLSYSCRFILNFLVS